jgi:hypothetical protein
MNLPKLPANALLAIAAAAVLLTVTTAGLLSVSQTVPSTGNIASVNVSIYLDSACTQPCTNINWGTLNPGATATQTIYVKNTGTVPITLSLSTSSWSPSNANSYLTLQWNKENTVLNAGASTQATLTLTVASNTGSLTTFSFNVVITGTSTS